ncbi:hypothetical protein WT81_11235 [Burkholderia stagnalis]|uniref:hypothetical protein n=1 Tax=Burkholderia stagnalis TaxID=1503054 RepID=UPI00075FC1CB|nr:hypothetical protein [Burkholderia stagnalis]KWK50029.1 hypothetical protein WT80_13845 [Burkholderia stagnalis]KWK60990.1 hypothetical protein WT81_11235 [Burkholderia stagnalis]
MTSITDDNEKCLCVGGPLPAGVALPANGVAVGYTYRPEPFTNVPSITASYERKSLTRQRKDGPETREFFVFDGEQDANSKVIRNGLSGDEALDLTLKTPALYWK